MMTEKEFIESQKECAKMMGMSLEEYVDYCKKLKVPKQTLSETKDEKTEYDNSILDFLGLKPNDLKIKKWN